MIWKILVAFGSMVALDFVWARYNIACAQKRAVSASSWAALIAALGAFVVLTYTEDHWMILPAALGGFVGTFFAVKMK
jgi:nitrate/nitrite transporter NarK